MKAFKSEWKRLKAYESDKTIFYAFCKKCLQKLLYKELICIIILICIFMKLRAETNLFEAISQGFNDDFFIKNF